MKYDKARFIRALFYKRIYTWKYFVNSYYSEISVVVDIRTHRRGTFLFCTSMCSTPQTPSPHPTSLISEVVYHFHRLSKLISGYVRHCIIIII